MHCIVDMAIDFLRKVVAPPNDGSPAPVVAEWLLTQEDAIEFLKKMDKKIEMNKKLKEAEREYTQAIKEEVESYLAMEAAFNRYHHARENAIRKLSRFNYFMKGVMESQGDS